MSGSSYGWWHFFWAGLARATQTGSVVPSSRFLIDKMIEPIPRDYSGRIVELGAGPGNITVRLAARCPAARILACEINPSLARCCSLNVAKAGLADRVTVVAEPAETVLARLVASGEPRPDYVLSGIPLANIQRKQKMALLGAVRDALTEGGAYIQFQYSLVDHRRIRSCFRTLRTKPVLLNFPPAFVYYAGR